MTFVQVGSVAVPADRLQYVLESEVCSRCAEHIKEHVWVADSMLPVFKCRSTPGCFAPRKSHGRRT